MLPLRDHLPTRRAPLVNYAIIGTNVAVFLLEHMRIAEGGSRRAMTLQWGLVPARVFVDPIGGVETVFTSMFVHGSLAHVAGNMLFLWIFGDNVEDALGHPRYLAFYLAGGVCAAMAQILVDPMSTLPMVGASGAISAVLAAYVFLYPRSPILVFLFVFPVHLPAWLVIGEYFLVNLTSAVLSTGEGGIAFAAHVGGFVGGALMLRAFTASRQRVDNYGRWRQWAERTGRRNPR